MSIDICCGPGVNVCKVANAAGCELWEAFEKKCGFPVPAYVSEYDLDDGHEYSSFLDELFYEYAHEHLPKKHGCPAIFSYHEFPATGDYFVYADARRLYEKGVSWDKAKEILAAEFGDGSEIEWIEFTMW